MDDRYSWHINVTFACIDFFLQGRCMAVCSEIG